MSRQSAFAYKGRSVDTRTIARELGCRYLVEGSVRRIDDRMRVTVQLIDAADDQHLWAERYDRNLTDVFALQDEICAQVVAAIESRISPSLAPRVRDAEASHDTLPVAMPTNFSARLRGAWWTIPAVAGLLGMAALLTWTWQQRSQERWAREEAMPRLQQLVAKDDYGAAFGLAREIEKVVPNDPQLRALEPQFSAPVSLATNPPGAKVYFRPFAGKETDWRVIGVTPIENQSLPLGVGLWRFEQDGRGSTLRVFRNPAIELHSSQELEDLDAFKNVDFTVQLAEANAIPPEMVLVQASNLLVTLVSDREPVDLPAFFLDRYEVTNREFKEFVDAGGYREPAHWQDLPFGETIRVVAGSGRAFRRCDGPPRAVDLGIGHVP